MPLLHHKSLLVVAAVTDVALNARNGPVSGKALAKHHHLPPRHLEPVLQALVRESILKAVRGPGGGYVLAREQRRITADDILRAARTGMSKGKGRYPSQHCSSRWWARLWQRRRMHSRTRSRASPSRT